MNNDIKTVLSSMYDLELNNYLMETAIDELDAEINKLAIPAAIERPIVARRVATKNMPKSDSFNLTVASVLACALIGLLVGFSKGEGLDVIITVPLGVLLGGTVGVFIDPIIQKIRRDIQESEEIQRVDRENKEYEILYQNDLTKANEKYEQLQTEEAERIKNENITKGKLLSKKGLLEEELMLSHTILKGLYDKYYIFEEYRNLVAVGYMTELVKIEAADTLLGNNGLYHLARVELRQDRLEQAVNGAATVINKNLDTIIQQGNRLYGAVERIAGESYGLTINIMNSVDYQPPTPIDSQLNHFLNNEHRNITIPTLSIVDYVDERAEKHQEYIKLLQSE